MTLAERAEKLLLGDVCEKCGEPYELRSSSQHHVHYPGLCPRCCDKKWEGTVREMERENERNRKRLRPGEMLYDDYSMVVHKAHLDPIEAVFLFEIAIIFNWGPLTRPLSRRITKEWWYIEDGKKPRPEWKLSGFDPRFVEHMIDNLTRCGIFAIDGDLWNFKGFPKGWRKKWKSILGR